MPARRRLHATTRCDWLPEDGSSEVSEVAPGYCSRRIHPSARIFDHQNEMRKVEELIRRWCCDSDNRCGPVSGFAGDWIRLAGMNMIKGRNE